MFSYSRGAEVLCCPIVVGQCSAAFEFDVNFTSFQLSRSYNFFFLPTAVPPPENVTVHCHNLENVAYWNYSQLSLLPRFVVYVYGYSR